MLDAHDVTRAFERELAAYCGARDAIAVNSCTMAILLAVAWWVRSRDAALVNKRVTVPKRTYVGVPMAVVHAGAKPEFADSEWAGAYQLFPSPVWDSARWLTHDIYRTLDKITRCTSEHALVCLSFHATKTLGIEQGGAILCDDVEAGAWLRRMRFDGRMEGIAPTDDPLPEIGWHCYMNPSTAAQGLMRMRGLPKHNAPLPNDAYPDLSLKRCFQ
jgi:dTDP-4-amino-4,6-dideoxygalactose transaminase